MKAKAWISRMGAVLLLSATSLRAAVTTETFDGSVSPVWATPGYYSKQWSVDKPEDNLPNTPHSIIRGSYDFDYHIPNSANWGGNGSWGSYPMLTMQGSVGPSKDFYLSASSGFLVRWESVDVIGYDQTSGQVVMTILDSNNNVLYTSAVIGDGTGSTYTVANLNFGNLPYDSGTMTMRLTDFGSPSQTVAGGYWGIDNLSFSEVGVPEPSAIGLLAVGGWVLWRRRARR